MSALEGSVGFGRGDLDLSLFRICLDICMDMCMDMWMDMCTDMCTDMCSGHMHGHVQVAQPQPHLMRPCVCVCVHAAAWPRGLLNVGRISDKYCLISQ